MYVLIDFGVNYKKKKKKLSGNKTMPYFLEYWREEDSSPL